MVDEFQERSKKNAKLDSIQDMKAFVESYPEFRYVKCTRVSHVQAGARLRYPRGYWGGGRSKHPPVSSALEVAGRLLMLTWLQTQRANDVARAMSGSVSKHVSVVGELSRQVGSYNVFDLSAAEQELACQSDHKGVLDQMEQLFADEKIR